MQAAQRPKLASNSPMKFLSFAGPYSTRYSRCAQLSDGKSLPHSQCVNGAAAKKFQKKAMGKFLNTVPSHIAGRSVQARLSSSTLNTPDATRLMLGHMTATVPAWRSRR